MLPAKRIKSDGRIQNVAGPSNERRMPPILTLDTGAFDELFDYLSLEDLCAIGRTCKQLQHAAGKYFQQNYPFITVKFGELRIYSQTILHESFETTPYGERIASNKLIQTNFAPYARRITIHGNEIEVFHLAAMSKCQSLKEITFDFFQNFTEHHYACIMKMDFLDKISSLRFNFCYSKFCDALLDRILRSCVGLKSLAFIYTHSRGGISSNCDWIRQPVPTLERLETWNVSLQSIDLRMFLQANPQIKKVKTNEIDSVLKIVRKLGMELDELEYTPHNDADRIEEKTFERLIALNKTGHIKNMQAHFFDHGHNFHQNIVALEKIGCFTSLRIDFGRNEIAIHVEKLVNLKKLHLDGFEMSPIVEADVWSKSLINLEEFYSTRNSLLEVMPLARQLPKLQIIEVNPKSNTAVDLKALNDDRKKLTNARKLKIYLHNEAFQEIRWTSIDMFCDMVEVRKVIQRKGNCIWFEESSQF